MSSPFAQERQSVGYYHVECGGEGPFDSSHSYRKGLITGEETRTLGGRANHPNYPNREEASEPEGVTHSGELAIMWR